MTISRRRGRLPAPGFVITGADPLTLTGDVTADTGGGTSFWDIPTKLGADVTIATTGKLQFDFGVSLFEGATGHALTVDGPGKATFIAPLTGKGSASTITKNGAGEMALYGAAFSWGPVAVNAGTMRFGYPWALPSGAPVSIASGATVIGGDPTTGGGGTWDNVFSGAGTLDADYSMGLVLTGASPDFTGPIVARHSLIVTGSTNGAVSFDGGVLGGQGTVGSLDADANGSVWPGKVSGIARRLTAGTLTLGLDADYVVTLNDATGVAGTGYDQIATKDTTVTADMGDPVVLSLASIGGGVPAPLQNWDPTHAYRWHVVGVSGGLTGFSADKFVVDTSKFDGYNDTTGGAFHVQTSTSGGASAIDVVWLPTVKFSVAPSVGNGGVSFAKGTTVPVTWTVDKTPPAGCVFRVSAVDPATGNPTALADVPAGSGAAYSYDWTLTQGPSAGWKARVELLSAASGGEVLAAGDSQAFEITAPGSGPSTTVEGADGSWVDHPVELTFTGHPGASGSPIAFVEYQLDNGAWVKGTTVTISAQGETLVQFRCQDASGVLEDPPNQRVIRIDHRRPQVIAKDFSATRGQLAKLRYKVKRAQPGPTMATVRLQVRLGKKVLTKASSRPVPVNKWTSMRVSLAKVTRPGDYQVRIRAQDGAGNWQKGWTAVTLTVR